MTTSTETIEVELDSACGPRVTYGEHTDASEVDSHIPSGYAADYSSQVRLSDGRYRAPLVEVL